MRFLKDPKTGRESVTLTAFVVGFLVCTGKLLLSGIKTDLITFEQFSGSDFGIAVGALGAIYTLRKNSTIKKDTPNG